MTVQQNLAKMPAYAFACVILLSAHLCAITAPETGCPYPPRPGGESAQLLFALYAQPDSRATSAHYGAQILAPYSSSTLEFQTKNNQISSICIAIYSDGDLVYDTGLPNSDRIDIEFIRSALDRWPKSQWYIVMSMSGSCDGCRIHYNSMSIPLRRMHIERIEPSLLNEHGIPTRTDLLPWTFADFCNSGLSAPNIYTLDAGANDIFSKRRFHLEFNIDKKTDKKIGLTHVVVAVCNKDHATLIEHEFGPAKPSRKHAVDVGVVSDIKDSLRKGNRVKVFIQTKEPAKGQPSISFKE